MDTSEIFKVSNLPALLMALFFLLEYFVGPALAYPMLGASLMVWIIQSAWSGYEHSKKSKYGQAGILDIVGIAKIVIGSNLPLLVLLPLSLVYMFNKIMGPVGIIVGIIVSGFALIFNLGIAFIATMMGGVMGTRIDTGEGEEE